MAHTTDRTVLKHIEELVAEEKGKLDQINVELDRCWDLLRQRRGLREFGRNPDDAEVRPAKTVENYRG